MRIDFRIVRDNILLLDGLAQLSNNLEKLADEQLVREIRMLGVMRIQFFGIPGPLNLDTRVVQEAKAAVYRPPTLEEKRRWFTSVPYHGEYFTPCRVMWIKVIIRAAYDYALWKNSNDLRQRKAALDAEKWLFGDSELLNSFKSICFLCRLPMRDLTNWAKNLTREQVKKFEFLERSGKDPMSLALNSKRASDGED